MELIVTILLAAPIGYFVRGRLVAVLTFVAVHSFIFTFQSMELTREWVGGDNSAYPKKPKTVAWSYGVVNLIIYAAGFGLVLLGGWLAARRHQRTASRPPEHV
jgi:hypothetical protein